MQNKIPTCANVNVLKQILNLVPLGLTNFHARETEVKAKASAFSVLSHLSAMLIAQPSHANKECNADFAEKLFWSVLGQIQHTCPDSAAGRMGKGLLRRFKIKIHAEDSTVIQLINNCMNWASHRRRKATVKMKLRRVEARVAKDSEW